MHVSRSAHVHMDVEYKMVVVVACRACRARVARVSHVLGRIIPWLRPEITRKSMGIDRSR